MSNSDSVTEIRRCWHGQLPWCDEGRKMLSDSTAGQMGTSGNSTVASVWSDIVFLGEDYFLDGLQSLCQHWGRYVAELRLETHTCLWNVPGWNRGAPEPRAGALFSHSYGRFSFVPRAGVAAWVSLPLHFLIIWAQSKLGKRNANPHNRPITDLSFLVTGYSAPSRLRACLLLCTTQVLLRSMYCVTVT